MFDAPEEVRRLSSLTTPTGPVGVFEYVDVSGEELLLRRQVVVLLDGVQDPGNVGTVIRSAHAFGAGVALSVGSADLYNPKTVRATMGSLFSAAVAREVDSRELVAAAKEAGFTTVAAVSRGGERPSGVPNGPVVIAVGSEGSGLPEELVGDCDLGVSIPSEAESLNAAVAASILLYEAHIRVLP
ncbi:SpoU rRNA Methylase family [Rubrobacter radiotolerans]|uniref:RNA methyltransferase n=1 Tax=Rubrobacter radiotolerans TaxID=42256 RepID=A0A023X2M9_RUBRA|nr:RNA methyltransferase [Rubrobacter radiotolerans]AHY46563.1 SpoU rRNA Methylase family [Rubrobacter radiotolerans]MDX5893970.1 RNA methyltransferase [Rubrobacter radiotolerans]